MVHDRIAAGETTVVPTAAVLRCGKQMEKLPHYKFSWTVYLQIQRNSVWKRLELPFKGAQTLLAVQRSTRETMKHGRLATRVLIALEVYNKKFWE
jgi:hypothetical protein